MVSVIKMSEKGELSARERRGLMNSFSLTKINKQIDMFWFITCCKVFQLEKLCQVIGRKKLQCFPKKIIKPTLNHFSQLFDKH